MWSQDTISSPLTSRENVEDQPCRQVPAFRLQQKGPGQGRSDTYQQHTHARSSCQAPWKIQLPSHPYGRSHSLQMEDHHQLHHHPPGGTHTASPPASQPYFRASFHTKAEGKQLQANLKPTSTPLPAQRGLITKEILISQAINTRG